MLRYKSGVLFSFVLLTCVGMSLWLSYFIPDDVFDNTISPLFAGITSAIAFAGSWLIFRHSDKQRIRKAWGYTLLAWGVADGVYLFFTLFFPKLIMDMGAYELTPHELLVGNVLGWFLMLYPTEALRPRWLSLKRALWQLLPMFALWALDYALPINLAPILILYPFVLLGFLISHVRAYRIWCEENFSTLDDIDVQWIMRYLVMVIFVGVIYFYMCLSHSHTRGFTQLWLVIFMLVYSTEQILFRRDPWEIILRKDDVVVPENGNIHKEVPSNPEDSSDSLRNTLEQWMEQEKPYTNPDFRLIDLQKVLPMNRTYLSQFIHNEYDCTFYQFVNRYRIDEAMRLKRENPNLKVSEVSALCGFSSPTVFTRIFTSFTGFTPRQWAKNIYSA